MREGLGVGARQTGEASAASSWTAPPPDSLPLSGKGEFVRMPFLRQQIEKRAPRANMCLADFIDPAGDWIGGFAVTAGHGIEPHLARFKAKAMTTIPISC